MKPKAEIQEEFIATLEDKSSPLEKIRSLLKEGADPNFLNPGSKFETPKHPMYSAASHPNIEVLRLLLQHGGKPNVDIGEGYTPYLAAASEAHIDLLIENGAAYPKPTKYNETPLRRAYHIADMKRVQFLLSKGAPREELQCTPIHWAVIESSPELSEVIAANKKNIEQKDTWSRSPLLLAFHVGNLEAAKALLDAGASLKAKDHVGQKVIHFAALADSPQAIAYAVELGFLIDETDGQDHSPLSRAIESRSFTAARYLIEQSKSLTNFHQLLDKAIYYADDLDMVKFMLEMGARTHRIESFYRNEMNPSRGMSDLISNVTEEEYRRAKKRTFGRSNPEETTEPYLVAMVARRWSGYGAWTMFDGENRDYDGKNPIWCADRMGQSITWLPDGRVIEIAGEHEDSYDPDFCIYNDVFVHEPGKPPRIYQYPREVFPPTDFHTATLVGDWIYIIGSLGYIEDRHTNVCPIYRLNIHSLVMEKVVATGNDPGRIYNHRAIQRVPGRIEVSDGVYSSDFKTAHQTATFDTATNVWL